MDDKELRELFKKNLEASQKSLELLKKMRRDAWYHRAFTLIKWLAILGVLAWAYTQLAPVFEQFGALWESVQGVLDNLNKLPGLPGQ